MLSQGDLDAWIEKVKKCDYLPENDLKRLCEWVDPSLYPFACCVLAVLSHCHCLAGQGAVDRGVERPACQRACDRLRRQGGSRGVSWPPDYRLEWVSKRVAIKPSRNSPKDPRPHSGFHGQFHDLVELLRTGGEVPSTSYIFMVPSIVTNTCLPDDYPQHETSRRRFVVSACPLLFRIGPLWCADG